MERGGVVVRKMFSMMRTYLAMIRTGVRTRMTRVTMMDTKAQLVVRRSQIMATVFFFSRSDYPVFEIIVRKPD
jgi:hypothetical protein